MLDVIFDGRPIQRFWLLETVARCEEAGVEIVPECTKCERMSRLPLLPKLDGFLLQDAVLLVHQSPAFLRDHGVVEAQHGGQEGAFCRGVE